jgi:hypothetical protein
MAMKPRFLLVAIVFAVGLVPLASHADIIDGLECAQSGLGTIPVQVTQGQLDRFAICVTDGTSANGAELYVGGEFQPDNPTDGGACSAVIVAGRTLYGDPDWARLDRGAKVFDTSDDVVRDCE